MAESVAGRRPGPWEARPFVGREDVLARLAAALVATHAGRLSGVVLGGPAGVGKSRTVAQFLATAPRGVGRQLVVTCLPDAGDLASASPLRQLLLTTSDGASEPRPTPAPDGGDALEQLVDDVLGRVRDAAREDPTLVLVVEDLQWADPASVTTLRVLVRALADEPVLLLVTHRDETPSQPVGIRALVSELDRHPRVDHVTLGPLERTDVERMVRHRLGRDVDDAQLAPLVTRSEGIPLFVEELADAIARGEADTVPRSLRDAFVVRLEQLDPATRDLVDAAAVCGPACPDALLAEVARRPPDDLERQLDDLLDAGLLVVDGAGTGYRFRHLLLHEVAAARVRPSARRRLHVRCAETLAARPDLTPAGRSPTDELARHRRAAGDPGPALWATLAAADEATASGAYADAFHLEVEACTLFDGVPEHERRDLTLDRLLARTARSAGRAGEHRRAVDLYERALATTDDRDERVALHVAASGDRYLAGDLLGAARSARAALRDGADTIPTGTRAVLLAIAARLRVDPAAPGEPLDDTTAALAIAEGSGDPHVVSAVLCSHALALVHAGRPTDARAALDEAAALVADAADPHVALRPDVFRTFLLQRSGATHDVVAAGRIAIDRAERAGAARSVGRQLRTVVADALTALGRWDEADALADDGLLWGPDGLAGGLLVLARARLAVGRGDLAAVDDDLALAADALPDGHPRASLVASELAWWRRDRDASRFHAERGLELVGPAAGLDELGALTHAFVRAVVALGGRARPDDHARAAGLAAELERLADAPLVGAWSATVAAELATDPRTRASAWATARETWRRLDHAWMVATAAWRAGEAAAATGDVDAAVAAFTDAESLATRVGARPLAVEIRASVAQLGAAATRGVPRDPATSVAGWGGGTAAGDGRAAVAVARLTRRESQVLALLAEGWTNKRIAGELGIGDRTVGTHVSNLLGKLGVDSRGEAAAVAHRARGSVR